MPNNKVALQSLHFKVVVLLFLSRFLKLTKGCPVKTIDIAKIMQNINFVK